MQGSAGRPACRRVDCLDGMPPWQTLGCRLNHTQDLLRFSSSAGEYLEMRADADASQKRRGGKPEAPCVSGGLCA